MMNSSFFSLLQIQVVQVGMLVLLVGLITRFLRNRYPHIAYALWLVVFVKCLTPPVMSTPFGLFAWQSSPMTESTLVATEPTNAEPITTLANKNESSPRSLVESARLEMLENEGLPVEGSADRRESVVEITAEQQPDVLVNRSLKNSSMAWFTSPTTTKAKRISGSTVAILFWFTGIVFVLIIAAGQWFRCWKIVNATRVQPDARLESIVRSVQRKLQYHRNVRIVVTDSEYGPMVFGYLRPVLILPKEIVDSYESSALEPLVAHELIHVRRGDTLMSLLQFVSTTIYWFNPLLWWANRQTNLTCERCCDLEVVEGLKCKPARYARTLLGVVESRQTYRGVVATAGIRPSEVTTKRLEWLAIQKPSSRRSSQRFGWVAAVLAALLVFPAIGKGSPQEEGKTKRPALPQLVEPSDIANAHMAFSQQEWDRAADLFEKALEKKPDDAGAWFRMGYALHATGRLEEAIVAHEQATKFPSTRRTGFYNWACALSLLGRHDQAIEKLTEALDAGFAFPDPLSKDPDFIDLLEDERFQALAKRHREIVKSQPPQNRSRTGPGLALVDPSSNGQPSRSQLDFMVGNWTVTLKNGATVGTSTISRQENGHIIHESFSGSNGMTGQTFSYFDSSSRKWIQNRVDSTGRIVNLSGTVNENKVIMTGSSTLKIGVRAQCRMSLVQLDDGRLEQLVEISKDNGGTWEKTFEGYFVPESKLDDSDLESDG